MIEAMSAGTPVIAWPNGSVPEVVTDGVSGRIVDSIEAAVVAVQQAVQMDRRAVRAEFEQRFTAERMGRAYIAAYRVLLARVSANTKIFARALPVASKLLPPSWEHAAGECEAPALNPAG